MMTYQISTQTYTMADGVTTFQCHSGIGVGLNNPDAVQMVGIGPLPPGTYDLGPWQDGSVYGPDWARLGPHICRLYPRPGDEMYGRDDFAIHGGNGSNPPSDSHGCIVTGPANRMTIDQSGDTVLNVIV